MLLDGLSFILYYRYSIILFHYLELRYVYAYTQSPFSLVSPTAIYLQLWLLLNLHCFIRKMISVALLLFPGLGLALLGCRTVATLLT